AHRDARPARRAVLRRHGRQHRVPARAHAGAGRARPHRLPVRGGVPELLPGRDARAGRQAVVARPRRRVRGRRPGAEPAARGARRAAGPRRLRHRHGPGARRDRAAHPAAPHRLGLAAGEAGRVRRRPGPHGPPLPRAGAVGTPGAPVALSDATISSPPPSDSWDRRENGGRMADTGMTPTDPAPFRLLQDTGTLAEGAAKLAGELRATPVKQVLADANRTAVRRGAPAAFGSMPKPSVWYAFDRGDQETADWFPQGLTCGADSGTLPVSVFLATWYYRPEQGERGIRVTFLSPSTLKYRHALLVEAAPDGSYKPIDIHAGGVACYGDLLYVADTSRG